MIYVECLSTNNHLLSFELPLTRQVVDYAIELAWGLV